MRNLVREWRTALRNLVRTFVDGFADMEDSCAEPCAETCTEPCRMLTVIRVGHIVENPDGSPTRNHEYNHVANPVGILVRGPRMGTLYGILKRIM